MTHMVHGTTLATDIRALLDERASCAARIGEIDAIVAEIRTALNGAAVELPPAAAAAAITAALVLPQPGDRAVPQSRPSQPEGRLINADLSVDEDRLSIQEKQIVRCITRHHPKAVNPSTIAVEAVVPYHTVNDRLPHLLKLAVLKRGPWGKYNLGNLKVNWKSSGQA